MGRGVRVAVIDTGINPCSINYVGGISFSMDSSDHLGHGTKIARIIGENDFEHDRLGVAPLCSIIGVKVMHYASETTTRMLNAIEWAASQGAQVINLSLAYPNVDMKIEHVLQQLDDIGIITVAAYSPVLMGLSSSRYVISAGRNEKGTDLVAPDVWPSVDPDFRGTSISAAIISGVAACAKADDPKVNRQSFLSFFQK